jgi:hypothetical protein
MIVMRFKAFLIALPFFAIAAPAAAQDIVFVSGTGDQSPVAAFDDEAASDDGSMIEMADKMADPAMQDGVAAAIETMTATMMHLPVGQFAEAIEKARPGTVGKHIGRDATIADLAGDDAEYFPEKLGDSSRQMMGMMGGFARAMAIMMPEFERMGRDMEESFRAAKAEAKRNRY